MRDLTDLKDALARTPPSREVLDLLSHHLGNPLAVVRAALDDLYRVGLDHEAVVESAIVEAREEVADLARVLDLLRAARVTFAPWRST